MKHIKFIALFVAVFSFCTVASAQNDAEKFNSAYISWSPSWLSEPECGAATFGNTVTLGWSQAYNLGTDPLFLEFGAALQYTKFNGTWNGVNAPFFYGVKMPVSFMCQIEGNNNFKFAPFVGVDLLANLRNEYKNASGSMTNADMRDLSASVHAGFRCYFTCLFCGASYEYYWTKQLSTGSHMTLLNLTFGFTF